MAKLENLRNKEAGASAYGRIIAENGREFYIREDSSLEIDIGREKRGDDPNYFCLADQNTISKKHAQISWDFSKHGFYIKNLSKNKVSRTLLMNNRAGMADTSERC